MYNQIAALVLGFALVLTATAAEPHWRHGGGFELLDVMADNLDITESQEAEIDSLISKARLENAVDRERISQLRERLYDLSAGPGDFDEGAAESHADELSQIVSRMAVSGSRLRWQVRQVLTEEQREQLGAWRGGHRARFMKAPDTEF
jgi:Spy/CpxP family protein refolding chaperone